MTGLASLFELETVATDRFRTSSTPDASKRLSLYGGLVMGQALRAAGLTVDQGRLPHSLHAYFLRPGRVDEPLVLEVDRDRDGGSFSSRHVRALQGGNVVISMVASFCVADPEVRYDAVPARVDSSPDELPGRRSPLAVEIREVTPTRVGDGAIRHSDRLWLRAAGEMPDDPLVHACAVAYVSDLGCGFGQTEIDGVGVDGPSIGHTIWFHTPIRADEWMLLDLWPVTAAGARGVYQGSVRNRGGALGALLTQEMLLRQRPLAPDVLRQMADYLGVSAPEPSGSPPARGRGR